MKSCIDWARRDRSVFPDEAMISGKITVTMPATLRNARGLSAKGPVVEIDNPLYSFKFPAGTTNEYKVSRMSSSRLHYLLASHESVLSTGIQCVSYLREMQVHGKPTTQRYDPNRGNVSAEQRNEELIANLTPFSRDVSSRVPVEGNLTERVLYILQSYNSFRAMTSNQWDPNRRLDQEGDLLGFGSVEDIHNALHNLSGGFGDFRGHMTNPAISSFDPIFWLHHW